MTQEQQFPARDRDALVERKGKLVRAGRRVDRLPRHQKGIERAVILIADIGEVVVGKGRIEVLAVAIDAGAHGAPERRFRPAADAGLRIRRDIRGIDRAERRRHRKAAGKVLAAAHGMTIVAIADRRQLAAAFDERGVERLRRGRLDRRDRRPPGDRKGSAAPPSSTMATMLATIRDGPVMRSPCAPFAFIAVGLYFNIDHPPPFTRESIICRRSALQGAAPAAHWSGVSKSGLDVP